MSTRNIPVTICVRRQREELAIIPLSYVLIAYIRGYAKKIAKDLAINIPASLMSAMMA